MMLNLIRSSLPKVSHLSNVSVENILPNVMKRYNYQSSKPIPNYEDRPKFEVTSDENDWKYVERLLPDTYVPPIILKETYASGWVPPKNDPNSPYCLKRTKNGMLPIYLKISHRGMRRITRIAHIYGDLQQFSADLKNYLDSIKRKPVEMRIHELCGLVVIHGDHVSDSKVWALKKGL